MQQPLPFGRQIRCAVVETGRLSRRQYRPGELLHGPDESGSSVHQVDPADGDDPVAAPVPNQHADAIAAEQSPSLIGDRVARGRQIEAAMHLPQIIVHACGVSPPLPQFSQLPIALEVGREIAHRFQQTDVALLGCR